MIKMKLLFGFIITICFLVFIFDKVLLFSILPHNYNSRIFKDTKKYSEEAMIFKSSISNDFLLIVPVYGASSFSSNNNMLGIYNGKNKLKDEIQLGSIPLRLKYWNEREIGLWVLNEKNELLYVKGWIKNKRRLWKYRLKYFLKETGKEIK